MDCYALQKSGEWPEQGKSALTGAKITHGVFCCPGRDILAFRTSAANLLFFGTLHFLLDNPKFVGYSSVGMIEASMKRARWEGGRLAECSTSMRGDKL